MTFEEIVREIVRPRYGVDDDETLGAVRIVLDGYNPAIVIKALDDVEYAAGYDTHCHNQLYNAHDALKKAKNDLEEAQKNSELLSDHLNKLLGRKSVRLASA